MCGINDYVQKLVKGIVLILAVAFMEFRKSKESENGSEIGGVILKKYTNRN